MLGVFESKRPAVEFCDRCSEVCEPGCRQAALRERAILRTLRFGVRL